ncbi:flagellar hook protein FlgE [Cellulosilyticum lentocellum]|uniref:Flagellar hook protein FlgE n=1 Tax=Cellulosilyticum lentocellum (strain ATCC 49066 / DSM 5427 / NCIMB 11756 / RHM5) TaxID=642492 RepID=F2JGR6_CELLD|nr:flagellar hook protein FlgE [Cellulosilyticum lentocellum]ADZ84158.1 flagellar hook-basal body protein [Cellulosilyticum lentocellum DSM 5427]
MMRSMFSAVSGLRVHQTRMDVIGNNIANVNTIGYKSQRVTFNDVFSQTLSSASAASDETGRGGRNPMQVGLGVNVSSIDMLMTQGAAQRTDNPFDLMINGEGFIVVGDTNGTYFTRAGALRADVDGNLIIANGMKVKGWTAQLNEETNKYEIVKGEAGSINLADPNFVSSKPKVTDKLQLSGNLNSTSTKEETNFRFYDSLGNYYSLATTLTPSTDKVDGYSVWEMKLGDIKDANGNKLNGTLSPDTAVKLYFDTNGKLASVGAVPGATGNATSIDLEIENTDKTSTFAEKITIDFSSMTQYASASTIDPKTINGNAAGKMIGYEIGGDGVITASYDNGDMRILAQVVVAKFDNPEGLEKVGDNLYKVTPNSGEFDGIGTVGTFNTGVLEMSNVDLSSEFTDMIVTQRGFQANSRIISVSDEMLQELTNLKR